MTVKNWQSSKMNQVEEKFETPMPRLLADLQNQHGIAGTCDILEISKATLSYWNLRCGISILRVAYVSKEGETVYVRGKGGEYRFNSDSD